MGSNEPIPDFVLDALEVIRISGAVNMADRASVRELLRNTGYRGADQWIWDNYPRYMEALVAMGERIAQRKGATK